VAEDRETMEALLPTLRHPRNRDALPDEELVALARQRDEAAVRALVKRHNRRLFRIARAVVRDENEAEDIVQEAYVRAFTGLDTFRGHSAFSTWMTRIALNEAYGRLRRRRPTVDLDAVDSSRSNGGQVLMFPLSPPPPDPDVETGREQVRRILQRAIDRLPERFRMVFVMRDVEGLSVEETAALLSVKPETVKTRLFRARRLMRGELENALSPSFSDVFPFAGKRCADMADRVVERLRLTT
jgi:RNA polymerase sigma-70 factor (ECF subfamily)